MGTGLVATGLDHDSLAVNGVRVGSNRSLGGFRGLELNERTVLLADDIKALQLAKSSQSVPEVCILDLIRHELNVCGGAFLIGRRSGNRLRSVLSLRVTACSLPSSRILTSGLSGGRGRGGSRSSSGLRSSGSGRSGSTALVHGRSSSLGERNNRLGKGSGSSAGPCHGLRRSSRLLGSCRRSSDRLGNGCRARILRLLGLLDVFLGKLFSSLISGLGGNLRLGLGGLSLINLLGGAAVESHTVLRSGNLLKLLINNFGIEGRGLLLSFLDRLGSLGLDSGSRFLRSGSSRLLGSLFRGSSRLVIALVIDISQDIIEDKVAGGLLGKDKGLDELLGRFVVVASLANHLDDDVLKGSLGVNIGYPDLAVVEV
jgi:hypothetical protein